MAEDLTECSPSSRAQRHCHIADGERIRGSQLVSEAFSIRWRDFVGSEMDGETGHPVTVQSKRKKRKTRDGIKLALCVDAIRDQGII